MQRHWPGALWEAACRGQPTSAVPGLQKHAARRGCPLGSPDLSHRRPCRPAAAGRGLCALSAHCCPGDPGQVLTLFILPLTEYGSEESHECASHLFSPQVQQNWLSVSKCRDYAQPTSERQNFFQGSVLQVTFQSLMVGCECSLSAVLDCVWQYILTAGMSSTCLRQQRVS